MEVRKFLVNQALESFSALQLHLHDLTEAEVIAALDLECGTSRRQSVIDRLISRAARLNEIQYVRQLKEKYHGKSKDPSDRS